MLETGAIVRLHNTRLDPRPQNPQTGLSICRSTAAGRWNSHHRRSVYVGLQLCQCTSITTRFMDAIAIGTSHSLDFEELAEDLVARLQQRGRCCWANSYVSLQ